MADLKTAVDFVLAQEDAGLTGIVTHTAGDPGGATRFGIAERWHPELIKARYFDAAPPIPIMGKAAAHAVAVQIYTAIYAPPLCLFAIDNQEVANRLLSFAVNEGPEQAIKIFQRALGAIVPGYSKPGCVDGVVGPRTLSAINNLNNAAPGKPSSIELRQQISADECAYYRTWVAEKPARLHLLHGLINRANA